MRKFDIHIRPIIIVLTAVIGPHLYRLPAWIILWCFFLWGYVLTAFQRGWSRPAKPLMILLSIFSFIALLTTFRRSLGSDAYIGLLSIMTALKPLEIKSRRDRMVTIFLAYFVIIANLFYSDDESLLMVVYMLISVLVTTGVLIHINHPAGEVKAKFRMAGKFMLQAVPFVLVLFFLFPRIQGSLWGIAQRGAETSGFSDRMSPGSVSDIVQNEAVAFRAKFEGPIPEPSRRYWRGIVFFLFDGKNWRRGFPMPVEDNNIKGTNLTEYTITLEPHKDKWLFVLDMPGDVPNSGLLMSDHTVISKRNVGSRLLYRASSFLDYDTGNFYPWEKAALQLPSKGNPRARELAGQWKKLFDSPEKIVDAALSFFQEEGFIYTLQAPASGTDIVDDFLFNTRKGYCEHYASAFTFLMRAAGIPARVAGGYLGGEINPYADYLIIRQSDAHAWSEVWLQGKGWTRIDPTSAVAPERIEQGVRNSLSAEDLSRIMSIPDLGSFTNLWLSAQFAWDMMNAYWTLWFMSYAFEEQQEFFERIGISHGSWKTLLKAGFLALGFIAIFTSMIIISLYYKTASKKDPVRNIYDKFCNKLGKTGIHRRPEQGPADYAKTIISARPDLKSQVSEITEIYIRLRYGRGGDKDEIKRFKNRVKQFKTQS